METMFGSSLSPVVCEGLMTYLRYVCLLAYTVVFNTYCVMLFVLLVSVLRLVYPMLPVSLDCPFLIAPLVLSNIYLSYK